VEPSKGDEIELISMTDDPNPIKPGSRGVVTHVDDIGTIFVKWNDGRTLGVVPGVDEYRIVTNNDDDLSEFFSESSVNNSMPKPTTTGSKDSQAGKNTVKNFKSGISKSKIKGIKAETTTVGSAIGQSNPVGKLQKENILTVQSIINEITSVKKNSLRDGGSAYDGKFIKKDKNKNKWFNDDKPLYKDGVIINSVELEKITKGSILSMVESLVESKDKDIHKEKWKRCVKSVEKNSPDVNPYAVCTDSLGYEGSVKKKHRKKEVDETTTFSSALGNSGTYVTPAFAAKKGKHTPSTKPIWRGGKIIQKINGGGVLTEMEDNLENLFIEKSLLESGKDSVKIKSINEQIEKLQKEINLIENNIIKESTSLLDEVNKVKWVKNSKYVKVKDKCKRFPYCNQGAIDKPIKLSNRTFENISKVSEKTGISENVILEKIINKIKK
jgi:predicted nucleotidyltransferase